MSKKAKNTHVMVRCDSELLAELDEVAESLGISRTTLVRMAIKYYLGEVKETGTVPIPKMPK